MSPTPVQAAHFNTTPVPDTELRYLLTGFILGYSELLLHEIASMPGQVLIPGDPVGKVITWLWRTDPDQAALRVADFMAQMRVHSPHANDAIRFQDFLSGLHFSLPNDVNQDEADQLVAFLRTEVPIYYGSALT